MNTLNLVLLIVCVSLAGNLVYLIAAFAKRSREMKLSGLIMLLSTPAGAVYYLGQFLVRVLSRRKRDMSLDDLSFSKERHNRVLSPDIEAEIQAVPLEELFLISADAEKRKRLLTELKKENVTNYFTIMKAFENEDPETSHYAAAAVTNAKADYENEIRAFDSRYGRDKEDMALVREYSDYVFGYLKSGILDSLEKKKFSYLYLYLMTAQSNHPGFLRADDYARIVDEALYVEDTAIAEQWAAAAFAAGENEQSYLCLLKVYYHTGRADLFFSTLEQLKQSDVALSQEGLALVRFFLRPAGAQHRRAMGAQERPQNA